MLFAVLATPPLTYLQYQRAIQPASSAGQHFLVVDDALWQHAQPSLNDLRIYAGEKEVPYSLTEERGGSESQESMVRILQPVTVGGKTQFIVDMSALAEYDRVRLRLATKNFVSRARVEGQNDVHAPQWAALNATTLYDLSDEKLGSNTTLQLPLSTYKYLRVTIENSVSPPDVEGAIARVLYEERAVLRPVGSVSAPTQQGKDTLFSLSVPARVPIERLEFTVDPSQGNFRRAVDIQDAKGDVLQTGEISRVHLVRHGQKIDSEETTLFFGMTGADGLKIVIHNEDNPPVQISRVSLQQYERRVYFDSTADLQARLFYGDDKLERPIYDYAKFFQKENAATSLQLGPEERNAAYVGRPDDRPWSERHPAVLWIAIIGAVAVLGAIALKSMKKTAAV